MKDFDLLSSLQAHTGNLQPASGVTHAELNELRRLVMLSVSSGQSPEDIGAIDESTRSLDSTLLPELEWLASTEALSAARPAESFRIARRDFGLGGPVTAEWARGLEPAQTLGPFVDEFGRQSLFDLFLIPKQFRVSRGSELLLVLPRATRKKPNEQVLAIPAGTVWIRANQLTGGVPPTAWTGVRVKGGQIEIPPGANLTNEALVIDVASPLNLQLELDPPSVTGPAAGPGSEATNAIANLPPTARFVFGPLGVETIETGAASLSLYGNDLTFTRNATPQSFEPTLRMVLISMAVDRTSLDIGVTNSKLFQPGDSAPIERAAWGLPVTISQPEQLGVAEGAGSLVLITKDGLTATWNGLPAGQTSLGTALIAVSPLSLLLLAEKATNFRGQQTFELWQEAPSRRSTIDIHFPRPFFFSFISSRNGLDSVAFQSQLIAHLDRPVRADGSRFPVDMNGMVILLENSTGTTVAMDANAQPARGFQPMAVALTNGLVTITPVRRLLVNGTLLNNVNIDKGTLTITSGIYQVLPILPDPYAANFASHGTQDSPLSDTFFRAIVTWPDPPRPSLEIALESPNDGLTRMLPRANRADRDVSNVYSLLDVSSGADQLGVSMAIQQDRERRDSQQLTVQSLSIHYPMDRLATFLLPQFQWEPVENTANELTGDTEKKLTSNDDGGPSFIHSDSVHLVPVAPVPVVREVVRTYKDERASVNVKFTLPFGITASAALRDRRYIFPPSLELLRAGFDDLRGARQISLSAGSRLRNPLIGRFTAIEPLLLGTTSQTANFPGQSPNNTLGPLMNDFNASFAGEVPIQRIEFSGYGASIFSRWVRSGDPDVGITQVSFDAFNGRTSFERILMVSYLWPCLSRVIRTIVLERQGSGSVLRWDSGWIATTPGLFTHQNFRHIHKGDIDGMYNIREIRDTNQIIPVKNAAVQAVYYDADLAFARVAGNSPVESGQDSNGRVPVRRQLGFIQRLRFSELEPPIPPNTFNDTEAALLTRDQFDELLQKVGPIGGPIDCRIRIGKSQQRKRVTLIQTERAGSDGGPVFAVVLYGSPVILGSGQWSVVSVDNVSRTVQPVDMKRGVPLIKRNGGPYRWADAIDLMNPGGAQRDYALLMAHDTQRFLLQRPKIEINAGNISSTEEPKMADPYSMLQSSGLFPRVDQAFNLPKTELIAETLKLATANGTLTHNFVPLEKTLLNLPSWAEKVNYDGAKLVINSLDNWKMNLTGLKQKVDFDFLKEIITLHHDFESVADQASKILEPKVTFPKLLQDVADVLDVLNRFAPDRAGGLGPFKINPQFHGTTFRLEIVADFKLATKDSDEIECGMGKVRGNLKVGAELTADLIKREIGGAVFLEISGSWQQLIFPLIYGGGHVRFFIRADHDGKTHLELDACVMGSIGGTLIPGLVDLEATVKYGYYIQVESKPLPGVIVGMEGRAKLLSGLLGFKFGVEGRALIDPHIPANVPEPQDRAVTLYGRIRVAGTVTVAWLIEESKSFETDFDVDVDWKTAFALAKAGLLPVP